MIGPLFGVLVALAGSQAAADIGPIIQSRCVPCHRKDGDAPFSLETTDDVRRRAATIASVTKSRYMPPWKPVPGHGDFQNTRRLTSAEIAAIEHWASAPDRVPLTLAPDRASTRDEPQPDVVVELPAYTLPPGGPDVFRNFVVPLPPGARIVRGLQFRPRGAGVHHANIRIDSTPASRALDAADPLPGYEGVIAHTADFPDGQFLGWTPGQLAPVLSDDTAWRLPAQSDLVVQLHLRPTGAAERIAPSIALYFGERIPSPAPLMIRLGKQDLDIPPGSSNHSVTDSFVLPVAVKALAIQAHAHARARAVDAYATQPDGVRVPLLRIDQWDVSWQDRYTYQQPVHLPAGTRITSTYTFGNDTADPLRWGWRSSDEMGDVWLQVATASQADRAALRGAITPKMLREDAIGSEVLLAREPNHLHLHNDVARIYLQLGDAARALSHFQAASRLDSGSAAALFNEGLALEAMGRNTEAAAKYSAAIALDKNYSPALNNSGAMLLRSGRIAAARSFFERAVSADPRNADAAANLGLTLMAAGEPDTGLEHAQRAIELAPELLRGMTPHVVLLAANANANVRRPREALALAEQILDVTTERAAVLDAKAICQAALGDFDGAVQTAGAALSATPAPSPALRDAIRQRIALYRKRQPFVLTP